MADQDVTLPDEWDDRASPFQEDMRFQRHFWRVQAMGWALLVLLLILAALGLFSAGPLSWTEARSTDGRLTVAYERFVRSGASTTMTIRLDGAAADAEHTLVFSHSLLETLTLETIQPSPERADTRTDGVHFAFASPGDGRGTVYLAVRPESTGPVEATIRVAGSDSQARLRLFVYP